MRWGSSVGRQKRFLIPWLSKQIFKAHTAAPRRQKHRFLLCIAQPTDSTSLKTSVAAHSVSLDHPISLPFHMWGSADPESSTQTEIMQEQAKVICSSSALAEELGYRGSPQLWTRSSCSMASPGSFPSFCVSAVKHQAGRTALQWPLMADMFWKGPSPDSWGPALPQPKWVVTYF